MMKSVATSLTAALSICGLVRRRPSTTIAGGHRRRKHHHDFRQPGQLQHRRAQQLFQRRLQGRLVLLHPAITGIYRLSTCGSGGDTILSVHSACPGTVQNQLACNDDNGPACVATNASLDFSFVAGQTYKVRVASFYQSFLPNFTFAVTQRASPSACGGQRRRPDRVPTAAPAAGA